jgi:hypothetical protein
VRHKKSFKQQSYRCVHVYTHIRVHMCTSTNTAKGRGKHLKHNPTKFYNLRDGNLHTLISWNYIHLIKIHLFQYMKLHMCVYMYHRYSCYCTCIIYLNYIHTYILYLCTCHYYYPRTTTHLHHPSKFRAFCHHLHFWTHAIHIDFHTGDQFKR